MSRALWLALVFFLNGVLVSTSSAEQVDLEARIRGLLVGSAIGDALGGPIEFQPADEVRQLPAPPKRWAAGETLDEAAKEAARQRLRMRPYAPLRPASESYGHWGADAPAGTITDDTRHKLILLDALRQQSPLDVQTLARTYMKWPNKKLTPEFDALNRDWLEEWRLASAWVLGERDSKRALPPERMWQGLPTCCGQMTSLPLAAVHPGDPKAAYEACYHLSYFDNSWGKDLNAALVAGLAAALTATGERSEQWQKVMTAMRTTDPLRYGEIRYTTRQVDHWLDRSLALAKEADRQPAALFAALDRLFAETIKWEAQVPFVVAMSCLALTDFDPLSALQLSIEWGHDTDSYAQLVGAFAGALHGDSVFPETLQVPVKQRLRADFDVDLDNEAKFLLSLQRRDK